jgi:hypothetical protein
MNSEEELLIEAAASAHREHTYEGVTPNAAWFDLDEAGRLRGFERARGMRKLEQAVDPRGLSATARLVLARIEKR